MGQTAARWLVCGLGATALAILGLRTGVTASGAGSAVDWIAYVRHDDVYVIDPETGATRRLTHGRAVRWITGIAGGLSISPDSTEVAYTAAVHPNETYSLARTIEVQSVSGGSARNVTPWNSVGVRGQQTQPQATHIDPHWVSSTRLDYTDDLESNGEAYGVAMTVNLATGQHSRAVMPSGGRPDVLEPFVAAGNYTAYPVLDWRGYSCASTLDVARATGTKQVRLTYTPLDDEEPLDINADGDVLAMRFWITSGPHDGLCELGGSATLTYELIVVDGDGNVRVLRRFPGIRSAPDFGAAWNPDGKQIAYINPAGDLMVMTPGQRSRLLVAGDVEALDW